MQEVVQREGNVANEDEEGRPCDQENIPDQGGMEGAAGAIQAEAAAGEVCAPIEIDAEGHGK